MKKFTKLFNTKPSSVDVENKSVTFTISDNQPDRMGEVVDQSTWNFKDYLKNPIVLWGHDPDDAENVLGQATALNVATDGSHTEATLCFATDINPKAKMVFDMIVAGILRTVSVGFINHSFEVEEDVPMLRDNELLEISVVPIPANPRAIALSYKEGRINQKDARWLLQSMKAESELIEKQLIEEEAPQRTKAMTDEQFDQVMGAITSLSEKVTAVETAQTTSDEKFIALSDQVAEAVKPADPVDPVDPVDPEVPPAKGGDIDQPGAEDEFDLDAELTDELQTKIDAELVAALETEE